MNKFIFITTFSLIATFSLLACSNVGEETVQSSSPYVDEKMEEDKTIINDSLSKAEEKIIDKFPDHYRLGETYHWHDNSAMNRRDLEATIKSFEILEELNGVRLDDTVFLAVNMTIKNNLETAYLTEHFVRGLAYDDRYKNNRRYEISDYPEDIGDYPGKLPEWLPELAEINATLIYEVRQSEYYRIFIFDNNWLLFDSEIIN